MRWDKLKLASARELRGGRIAGNERCMVEKLARAYLAEERCNAPTSPYPHERRAMQAMMQAALGSVDRRWWLDEAAWRLSRRWLRRGPS